MICPGHREEKSTIVPWRKRQKKCEPPCRLHHSKNEMHPPQGNSIKTRYLFQEKQISHHRWEICFLFVVGEIRTGHERSERNMPGACFDARVRAGAVPAPGESLHLLSKRLPLEGKPFSISCFPCPSRTAGRAPRPANAPARSANIPPSAGSGDRPCARSARRAQAP